MTIPSRHDRINHLYGGQLNVLVSKINYAILNNPIDTNTSGEYVTVSLETQVHNELVEHLKTLYAEKYYNLRYSSDDGFYTFKIYFNN